MKRVVFFLMIIYSTSYGKAVIKVQGSFLFEFLHEVKFELLSKTNFKKMKITLGNSECTFKVDQLTLPHLPSGRRGKIYTNKTNECIYSNEKERLLFETFSLIDFTYTINKQQKLIGRASVSQSGKRQSFKIKALE